MITCTFEEDVVFIYEIEPMNAHELCEALMSFDDELIIRRTDTVVTNYHNGELLKTQIVKVIIETKEDMHSIPNCVKYVNNYIRKVEVSVQN